MALKAEVKTADAGIMSVEKYITQKRDDLILEIIGAIQGAGESATFRRGDETWHLIQFEMLQ